MKLQIAYIPGGASLRDTDQAHIDHCRIIGKIYSASDALGILDACNAHDQLVADNAALRADLNDARSNWEAGAEELRQADLVREQLVAALKDCARHSRKAQRDNIVAKALLAAGAAP